MPSIRDMGLLADAVYLDSPTATGWTCAGFHAASGALDGFQAATFKRGSVTVIAFRGTAQGMDAIVDLKLGTGMNSSYFSAAEEYCRGAYGDGSAYVTGHSLGGAIAQVVANRRGFKFATFNAPGVAVVASRNLATATIGMSAIRTAGMIASAVRHPMQAARDVGAAFNAVHGLNVCLEYDAVSEIGVHYGEVIRISGTSMNPLTEHRMTTMNAVIASHPVGAREVAAM